MAQLESAISTSTPTNNTTPIGSATLPSNTTPTNSVSAPNIDTSTVDPVITQTVLSKVANGTPLTDADKSALGKMPPSVIAKAKGSSSAIIPDDEASLARMNEIPESEANKAVLKKVSNTDIGPDGKIVVNGATLRKINGVTPWEAAEAGVAAAKGINAINPGALVPNPNQNRSQVPGANSYDHNALPTIAIVSSAADQNNNQINPNPGGIPPQPTGTNQYTSATPSIKSNVTTPTTTTQPATKEEAQGVQQLQKIVTDPKTSGTKLAGILSGVLDALGVAYSAKGGNFRQTQIQKQLDINRQIQLSQSQAQAQAQAEYNAKLALLDPQTAQTVKILTAQGKIDAANKILVAKGILPYQEALARLYANPGLYNQPSNTGTYSGIQLQQGGK